MFLWQDGRQIRRYSQKLMSQLAWSMLQLSVNDKRDCLRQDERWGATPMVVGSNLHMGCGMFTSSNRKMCTQACSQHTIHTHTKKKKMRKYIQSEAFSKQTLYFPLPPLLPAPPLLHLSPSLNPLLLHFY